MELSIPGRTYGLHDIAMFNLLKVMEICLHENEGNAALTYEGLLEQIRAKISHYITLMVEGSNICDIGHRDWAPVPLLSSFSVTQCAAVEIDKAQIQFFRMTRQEAHQQFVGITQPNVDFPAGVTAFQTF